jgi:ankyrin repeat protein
MLWDAIRKQSEHNVKVILEANFPVDYPLNPLGMTALHFACCNNSRKELIMALLEYGPDVNIKDYAGNLLPCYIVGR